MMFPPKGASVFHLKVKSNNCPMLLKKLYFPLNFFCFSHVYNKVLLLCTIQIYLPPTRVFVLNPLIVFLFYMWN